MILRLSTRQASLESRLKVLTEIASDNGIILSLEGDAALNTEVGTCQLIIIKLIIIWIDQSIDDHL